jgi:hypothetical protein
VETIAYGILFLSRSLRGASCAFCPRRSAFLGLGVVLLQKRARTFGKPPVPARIGPEPGKSAHRPHADCNLLVPERLTTITLSGDEPTVLFKHRRTISRLAVGPSRSIRNRAYATTPAFSISGFQICSLSPIASLATGICCTSIRELQFPSDICPRAAREMLRLLDTLLGKLQEFAGS